VSTNARSTSRRLRTAIAIGAVAAALAGCNSTKWGFPYKAPVQQGNWITSEQVALLRVGMTREQVRFALGSPTLTSVLHADRWDYPYYFKPGYGTSQERKFTVWFDHDKVVRWDGDHQPDVQPFQLAEEQAKAKAAGSSGSAGNAAAQDTPPGASPAPGSTGASPAPVSAPAAAPAPGATAPAGAPSNGLPAGVSSDSGSSSDAASANAPADSTRTTQ
jgi:outer membrane protein assembly factor BamE